MSRWVLMELNKGKTPEGRVLISEPNWAARYALQVMAGEDTQLRHGLLSAASTASPSRRTAVTC